MQTAAGLDSKISRNRMSIGNQKAFNYLPLLLDFPNPIQLLSLGLHLDRPVGLSLIRSNPCAALLANQRRHSADLVIGDIAITIGACTAHELKASA